VAPTLLRINYTQLPRVLVSCHARSPYLWLLDSNSGKWQVTALLLKFIKLPTFSCMSYPLSYLRYHKKVADFLWSRLQAYDLHTLVASYPVKWTCAVMPSLDHESGSVKERQFYFPTCSAVYLRFILVSQGMAYQTAHTVSVQSNTPAKKTDLMTTVPALKPLSTGW
jgi:hypothetical protein